MASHQNITSIAHLGFIWGLYELRAALDSDDSLADEIKIMYIKTESVQLVTQRRLAATLASHGINQEGFTSKDAPMKKIEILLKNFNIKAEHENGILVACNGGGRINSNLQNNAVKFREAINAANAIPASEDNNIAVFIDSDVKEILLGAVTQAMTQSRAPMTQTTPEMSSEDELENFEKLERRKRDPSRRFSLLEQSTKKLQNFFGNFTSVAPNQRKHYLKRMERMIDLHGISTSRANESYQELRDDKSAEKKALESKIAAKEAHLNELLEEMTVREAAYKQELEEKEKSKEAAERKIQQIKKEDKEDEEQAVINELQAQIETYKTEMQNLIAGYSEQEKISVQTKKDLEDEKDELALKLDKKILELQRIERNYEESKQRAEALVKDLERENLTPAKLYQTTVDTNLGSPHTIKFDRRPNKNSVLLQEPAAMPKPTSYNLMDVTDDGSSPQIRTKVNSTSRRPIICKPANFGLNTWNPDTTDIYVHLDKAVKAGKEALNVGATDTSVRRMILNSLGSNCDHVENFIEGADEMSLEKFAESIGKVLGKKSSVQMQSFLTAQRRSGEDLLAYYTRLHMLYRSSNKLTENKDWENDATHSLSFYSKLFDACYQAQKTELIRKTEELLEKGNLTLPRLKGILVEVNKIDSTKRNAEEPNQEIAVLEDKSKYQNNSPTYKPTQKIASQKAWYADKDKSMKENNTSDTKKDGRERKTIVCWYCAIPGHTKAQCFRYLKKVKEEKGEPRETKTRGNHERKYTQH